MKITKQFILSTCIIFTCILFTTIVFAKNDTLNITAKDNAGFSYDPVKVQNKTQFTAHVKVTYPGCKNDDIIIAPKSTGSAKRGACLITKIEATFDVNGAASVTNVSNFSSTGISASNFAIEENAINQEQTAFECLVYRSDMNGTQIGIKPGFVIRNNINNNINVKKTGEVQLYVTINGKSILIPFGESRQFDTYSGYFALGFQFKDSANSYEYTTMSGHYSGAPVLFSKATESQSCFV
jgi:hypothetical protein